MSQAETKSNPPPDLTEQNKPFARLYKKRVANNADLAVIISDHQNRRGTGKTTLSLRLAQAMDRTEDGLTEDKVALSPNDLTDAYIEEPKGSALVLDEAEAGLSKYEAASPVNRAMRELVSMGRVREKYLVLNLPASSELDRDLKALCDFWYLVKAKGTAVGHHLRWNPYTEEPRTPKTDLIEWNGVDEYPELQSVYDHLHKEKMKHLRGEKDQSDQRLSAKEVRHKIEQAEREASKETRNKLLGELYENSDLTQRELAEALDLSRSRIGQILRE